jgi:hypothetical protein
MLIKDAISAMPIHVVFSYSAETKLPATMIQISDA